MTALLPWMVTVALAASAAAQQPVPPAPAATSAAADAEKDDAGGRKAGDKTASDKKTSAITLTGCVSRAPGVAGNFIFVDRTTGAEYRLTGRGISKWAGKSVEIIGGSGARRFSIRGGLRPTPNVAGQAGAIDPAQAAVASRPGGGSTGTMSSDPPEFRVNRVRAVEGVCR